MVRNNVFIPEYWAHITPRYILPVTILTIVGASFCGLLWKRSLFACGHIGLFVFWPKAEMSTTELTFTISLSVALVLMSLITPAFSTSIIRGLNKRKKVSDKTAFDSKNTELIKG